MTARVTTWTMVVPFEAIALVVRDPDLMVRRIGVATKNVDDPFFDSVHAPSAACFVPRDSRRN